MLGSRLLLVIACLASCERAAPDPAPPPPRPQPPVETIDLVLAIDLSKSMEEMDLPPDRLGATKTALRRFVATTTHDRIGIVLYAQKAKRLTELTGDMKAIDRTLDHLQIGDVPELGTAIGDGLGEAIDMLRASPAKHKAVLLVGDGDNNWVTRLDPTQAANAAKQAGIVVYTFLSGAETTDQFGGMSADPKTLLAIATTTGGTFYRTVDTVTFDLNLKDARAKLDASVAAH